MLAYLVADHPECVDGVFRVPQLDVVRLVQREQYVTHVQRQVGQGVVLDHTHQPRHQLQALAHSTLALGGGGGVCVCVWGGGGGGGGGAT